MLQYRPLRTSNHDSQVCQCFSRRAAISRSDDLDSRRVASAACCFRGVLLSRRVAFARRVVSARRVAFSQPKSIYNGALLLPKLECGVLLLIAVYRGPVTLYYYYIIFGKNSLKLTKLKGVKILRP